jgi:hypothetical protein
VRECAGMSLEPCADLLAGGERRDSTARRTKPPNLVRGNRACKALQLEIPDTEGVGRFFRSCENARPDKGLTAFRTRAQPGGEAGDRAECAVVVAALESNPPECRMPGFDPDPQRKVRTTLEPTVCELGEAGLSCECETYGLQLVLGNGDGIVENTMTPSPAKCSSVPL